MGCSQGKQTIEAAMSDAQSNPSKGLPSLLNALEASVKDSGAWGSIKDYIPSIFKIMPKAMESLNVKDPRPVLAACKVIEYCVKVHIEHSEGSDPNSLDVESLKLCTRSLIGLLKNAQEMGAEKYKEDSMEDPAASKEVKAIGHATVALFRLSAAAELKKEWKWDGIKTATLCLDVLDSGIKREAQQAIAWMMNSFMEDAPDNDNAEGLIGQGITFKLCPYVAEPEKYDVPKDMLVHAFFVLEQCVNSGKDFNNKTDVEAAIVKARAAVQKRRSSETFQRQISPMSADSK